MNSLEQAPRFEEVPDFGMELDMGGFDINAAFQEAIQGIASDTELALEERVHRMEVILSEGESEMYRDFVDFRQIAAQMEMMCSHDHALNQSMESSDILSGFMDRHKANDGHDHGSDNHKDDSDDEIDPKTGKKTKKKRRSGWLVALLRAGQAKD